MFVGVMELHMALVDNDSIKDKRSVVKRLIHRCRGTFNVGISEVEEHDATDRAVLAAVAVNCDRQYLEGQFSRLEAFVERQALAELLDTPVSIEVY